MLKLGNRKKMSSQSANLKKNTSIFVKKTFDFKVMQNISQLPKSLNSLLCSSIGSR